MKSNVKGSLILVLCSFFWGMAFSAQSSAMEHIGPYTFVFLRSVITSGVLFAGYPLLKNLGSPDRNVPAKHYILLGGVLGVILVAAVILQQVGIVYTTAAKSGFVTALYIVLIPLIGLCSGKRIGGRIWIGVVLAVIGLSLLCLRDDLSVNIGDILTFGCALVFSFHIILIDRYAGSMSPVLLSAIQFLVCALIALPLMLIFEKPTVSSMIACWTSVVYTAVFSGAIGYTLQFIGQKYTEPTLASLIMCLESVFSAIGGWILLGQRLAPRELIGCILMLSASVIAQLPFGRKKLPR